MYFEKNVKDTNREDSFGCKALYYNIMASLPPNSPIAQQKNFDKESPRDAH